MDLTDTERQLAEDIDFSHDICALVKQETGKSLERAYGIDEENNRLPALGLSVMLPNDQIEAFFRAHRRTLLDQGYRAFWSERTLENGLRQGDELIVLKTTNHHAIITLRQTDGANYDVFTDDILEKLRQWEQISQFTVVGAATDWVALEFLTLPEHLCAFAEDIYRFCPDSVEQGVGLRDEEDDPDAFAAARRLCPDLSETFRVAQSERSDKIQLMIPAMPDALKHLMEIAKHAPGASADMGVKLLAYELQKTKYLFLWWD